MTRAHTSVIAAALGLALSAPALAQTRPDFSGTWNLIEPKAVVERGERTPSCTLPEERILPPVGQGIVAAGGQDGFHPTLMIKQTAAEFSVEGTTYHQDPQLLVYELAGETTFTGEEGTTHANAAWDGDKLVIVAKRTYSTPVGDMSVDTKEVYGLVGGILNVDRTETTAARTTRKLARYKKG